MHLRRTTTLVIVAGCLIALITFGLRTSLGLFTEPLSVVRGWDRETFLAHTCRKAGLPEDAWKGPGVELAAFTAEVFGE